MRYVARFVPFVLALVFALLLIASALVLSGPSAAGAAFGAGNATCNGCTLTPGPNDPRPPCWTVFCEDTGGAGGTVTGVCSAPGVCMGQSFSGFQSGGVDAALQQLMSILQKMGQQGGGGAGGSPSGSSLYPRCEKSVLTNGYVTTPCTDEDGNMILSPAATSTSSVNSILNSLSGETGVVSGLFNITSQADNTLSALTGSTSIPGFTAQTQGGTGGTSTSATTTSGAAGGVTQSAPVLASSKNIEVQAQVAFLANQVRVLIQNLKALGGAPPEGLEAVLDILAPPSTSAPVFIRDLTEGSRGDDVRALQVFLNARGFRVAVEGPGSPGSETTYFGPATRAALAKFQAVNNIAPALGYFGPATRAFVLSL